MVYGLIHEVIKKLLNTLHFKVALKFSNTTNNNNVCVCGLQAV